MGTSISQPLDVTGQLNGKPFESFQYDVKKQPTKNLKQEATTWSTAELKALVVTYMVLCCVNYTAVRSKVSK